MSMLVCMYHFPCMVDVELNAITGAILLNFNALRANLPMEFTVTEIYNDARDFEYSQNCQEKDGHDLC